MLNSMLAVVAPTGVQANSANLAPGAPSGNRREEAAFAEVLAQSAERAGARAEAAAAREHSGKAPERAREKADETETTPADTADRVDLAVLLALAAAENLLASLPGAGKPAADTPGMASGTSLASDELAGFTPAGLHGAAVAPAIGTGKDLGFAGVLVQSTEPAGARDEAVAARGYSSIAPDLAPGYADETNMTRAGAASRVDLVALLPREAESQPAPLPIEGKPVADTAAIQTDTRSASGESAAGAATVALAHGTAKAAVIGDPSNGSTGLIPAAAKPSEPGPVTGTDRNAPRSPPVAGARGEGWSAERAAANAGGLPAQHARSTEFQDAGGLRKTDEQYLSAARQVETATAMNLSSATAATPAGAHSAVSTGPAATVLVPAHVQSPAWSKDFGQQVIRLAVEGRPAAEIHLNPPDWGPIRVSIEMKGQDATLQFVAEHALTREALEAALPRLREMFAAGSLTLAGADVSGQPASQHSPGSQGRRLDQPPATADAGRAPAVEDAAPRVAAARRPVAGHARVDLFA